MPFTSPDDILNAALRSAGATQWIGDIYEGSAVARTGLQLYGLARDSVMRAKDWTFARRDVGLTANGLTAPQPWLYEYTYPSDCLRIRYVMPGAVGTYPVLDPQPQQFTDYNDQRVSPAVKAILANVTPATLVYTSRITDPTTWDANFLDALVEDLGRRFAAAKASLDMVAQRSATAAQVMQIALDSQTNQPPDSAVMQQQRRQ